jgi:hypothetical protein
MGIPVGYDEFAARWETDPMLKKLVDRFDGQKLVLKTQASEPPPVQKPEDTGEVGKMAMNAVPDELK